MKIHKIELSRVKEGNVEVYVGGNVDVELYVNSIDGSQSLAILDHDEWKTLVRLVNRAIKAARMET